ncbi:hypothetical protein NGRA_0275 [Nosema granulosis]|uniref:Uncharacterized protein n=1 Tax=Nosema granulosis TaxID=83296 RepID=A0A9P6H1M6_9MICR|nr:hypothetical protein NGRA_0275 [Nosema granulosis]
MLIPCSLVIVFLCITRGKTAVQYKEANAIISQNKDIITEEQPSRDLRSEIMENCRPGLKSREYKKMRESFKNKVYKNHPEKRETPTLFKDQPNDKDFKLFFYDPEISKDPDLKLEYKLIEYELITGFAHPILVFKKFQGILTEIKSFIETMNLEDTNLCNLKTTTQIKNEQLCESLNILRDYFLKFLQLVKNSKKKFTYKWEKCDYDLYIDAIKQLICTEEELQTNTIFFFMKNMKLDGCHEMAYNLVYRLNDKNIAETHLYLIPFFFNFDPKFNYDQINNKSVDFWRHLQSKKYLMFYLLSNLYFHI